MCICNHTLCITLTEMEFPLNISLKLVMYSEPTVGSANASRQATRCCCSCISSPGSRGGRGRLGGASVGNLRDSFRGGGGGGEEWRKGEGEVQREGGR